jgi:plastocyanin
MTSRVRIVFGLFALALIVACKSSEQPSTVPQPSANSTSVSTVSSIPGYEVVQVADGGSISGVITVSGAVSKLPKREIKKDQQVCGTQARDSEQLLVSAAGGLKNAIVVVEDVKRGKSVPASLQNVEIDQKHCEYDPHVMVVGASSDIAVRNSDPLLHNIHFYQNDDSLFNIAQPVQNQVDKHTLDKAGMVYAECDVHNWMKGHVAVVDNPYYAITDENGKFSIVDLPPGNYKVKIWHEYLGEKTQGVGVGPRSDSFLNLDLKDLLAAKKNPTDIGRPITNAAPAGTTPAKSPDTKAATDGKEVVVKMVSQESSFRYEPADITIKVGTAVRWVNASDNKHTSTDDPNIEDTPGQAQIPSGAQAWTSPFLSEADTFTHTFTVPGKYRYFCRNHGQFGMLGTITVIP